MLGTFLNSHVQFLEEESNINSITEIKNNIIIDLEELFAGINE
jgi:hypothetical protein